MWVIAIKFTWSYGKVKIKLTGNTPTDTWEYGKSNIKYEYEATVAGKISRYHNLSGLGGQGDMTFNPLG